MAESIEQIVNMALALIGEEPITDISEQSKPARFANARYAAVRDEVLRSHPWNVACKRAQLTLLTDIPVWGYARQFQLPVDFLKLVLTDDVRVTHRIEGDRILSDQSTLFIVYVSRLTDVSKFDPLLTDAIAAKLAAELAVPLTNNLGLMQMMFALYEAKLSEARFQDSREGPVEKIQGGAWVEAWEGQSSEPYRAIKVT